MKHIIGAIIIILVTSCSLGKLEMNDAKACVEGFLEEIRDENFDQALTYYSDMFNESEPEEEKLAKLKRLHEVMGPITSYELRDSVVKTTPGEVKTIGLTYYVQHTKVNAIEKYTVINDEGEVKIVGQNVEVENL